MNHAPRSTLKDVARYLKEELEVSVKTIERESEEYASQTCTSWSGRRRSVHVTYAGGWLLLRKSGRLMMDYPEALKLF